MEHQAAQMNSDQVVALAHGKYNLLEEETPEIAPQRLVLALRRHRTTRKCFQNA